MVYHDCYDCLQQSHHSLPALYRERFDSKEKPDTAQLVLDAASLLSQAVSVLGANQDHLQLQWTSFSILKFWSSHICSSSLDVCVCVRVCVCVCAV